MHECHITVDKKFAVALEAIATVLHWKYSCIDGDPVLGKQAFAYLTTHDTDFERMAGRMDTVCGQLGGMLIPVIRKKIELIVYDTKRPGEPCQGIWNTLLQGGGDASAAE